MPQSDSPDVLKFRYKFQFENGEEKQFDVLLQAQTLEVVQHSPGANPPWTKLQFHQCHNCPLKEDIAYCPVAVNISHLIEEFKFSTSYDKTWVVVETPERTYAQQTTVQNGLSAILGIYMVTSGCPILDYLRPMVRFHLPFATTDETVFRAVSMYLAAQYFRERNGLEPNWNLDGLVKIYKEVSTVNKGMWNRLSHASGFDANVNALIVLNTFGDALRFSLKRDLENLSSLFTKYLEH
ncbi:MAG: hypothetical protein EHM64_07435 [Ignavibacteriae bacterium]|nr:MAG: hypothetical protein EHM64_07435 [Ignavibacteriota bacterium]